MVKKEAINDIDGIKVISGQIISRIEAKDKEETIKTINILVPKAIDCGTINKDKLGTVDIKVKFDEKRIAKRGDIVIKLSTSYNACIIGKEDEGLLVPSFCAVINNVPDYLDKDYLVTYLNSSACFKQIKDITKDSFIHLLSPGVIKQLDIPIVDINKQRELASLYKQTRKKIRLLTNIIRLEQEKLDCEFYKMEEN